MVNVNVTHWPSSNLESHVFHRCLLSVSAMNDLCTLLKCWCNHIYFWLIALIGLIRLIRLIGLITTIDLKRFQVLPLTDIPSRKLHTMVTFPIHQFTMNAYTSELTSAEYDLVAVSNHSGELHGGHYTSHTRNTDTGHWHLWSDSIGSQCNDLEFTQSRDAYVLFYQCTSM